MATNVYDLRTLDGLQDYLTTVVLADVRKAFTLRGSLAPFGIVFAMLVGNEVLQGPRPLVVGQGPRAPEIKQAIQGLANVSRAVGCVYARQDTFNLRGGGQGAMIVVQLEHQTFPDMVWHAQIHKRVLEQFVGPVRVADTLVQLKQTAFLPQRWMA